MTTTPFELHASSISIERNEDYHTEPKDKQKKFTAKIKVAKAIVYCHTIVDGDKVTWCIMHPAFPGGMILGELPYKDLKDEEQALFAGVWESFIFFLDAGYHHLEIVTTFKRIKGIVNGDIECANNIEEEMLGNYNESVRTAPISVEFTIVDKMPQLELVRVGDVE